MEINTKSLTVEQHLQLRTFTDTMKLASPQQTLDMLVFVYVEMLNQKNSYNQLIKTIWNLNNGDV